MPSTPPVERSIIRDGRNIRFFLHRSRRKTVGISVYPDGKVAVRAPAVMSESQVLAAVQKRASWIEKHLHSMPPPRPCARFVDGEQHLYLGEKYRLKVSHGMPEEAVLRDGFLHITAASDARAATVLHNWYVGRALVCFPEIVDDCWQRYGFCNWGKPKPRITIRRMKTRWGSMSSRGAMSLNLALIKTPRRCIEYVVVHELCHMRHANHGKEFYALQTRYLPDWRARKHELETIISQAY